MYEMCSITYLIHFWHADILPKIQCTSHIDWVYYSIYCKYLDNICQQSTLLSQNIVRLYKYISQTVTFAILSRWFENKKQQFFKINVKMSLISSYSAAWISWPKSRLTRLQIFHLFLFHKKYCDYLWNMVKTIFGLNVVI